MTSAAVASARPSSGPPLATKWARERWFFGSMAVAATLTIFWGFAPTYYLRPRYGTSSLSWLLQLHGAVFTAWMVLYVIQTALIQASTARQDSSRKNLSAWRTSRIAGTQD